MNHCPCVLPLPSYSVYYVLFVLPNSITVLRKKQNKAYI